MLRQFIKFFLYIFALIALYIAVVLTHGTMTDFQPEDKIELEILGDNQNTIEDSTLSFLNWNVGFCGLGEESNFFYDNGGFLFSNGKMVRSPKEAVLKNFQGLKAIFDAIQADFFLLQELDTDSKRSYHINQFDSLRASNPDLNATIAYNYVADRVPLPILEPWNVMGEVNSGVSTFSRFESEGATRYQFPGNYDWPTRIFQLDRCFILQRFQHANGKDVIVINTHNSAYDKGGKLKKQQMAYLKEFLIQEYEKGNYVIVGGDWNQCPPNFRYDSFPSEEGGEGYTQINIPMDYLPEDWIWVYDPTTATNRKLTNTFEVGETFTTLIDFYLISPNVRLKKVKTINQEFQFSDHQPIYMEVELL